MFILFKEHFTIVYLKQQCSLNILNFFQFIYTLFLKIIIFFKFTLRLFDKIHSSINCIIIMLKFSLPSLKFLNLFLKIVIKIDLLNLNIFHRFTLNPIVI